jgi:hypothetical protein
MATGAAMLQKITPLPGFLRRQRHWDPRPFTQTSRAAGHMFRRSPVHLVYSEVSPYLLHGHAENLQGRFTKLRLIIIDPKNPIPDRCPGGRGGARVAFSQTGSRGRPSCHQ